MRTGHHTFCRSKLGEARRQAVRQGVKVPANLRALRELDGKTFFVEGDGMRGEFVQADCAWHAKAEFIFVLLNKAADEPGQGSPNV